MSSQTAKPFFENHFTWWHAGILLGFLLAFGTLNHLALSSGSPDNVRERPIVLATLATPLGPLVGAIARHGQSCCLNFSLALLPYCGSFLLGGLLLQFVRLPFGRFDQSIRICAWCVGLFGWFAGIPVSFMHALF